MSTNGYVNGILQIFSLIIICLYILSITMGKL